MTFFWLLRIYTAFSTSLMLSIVLFFSLEKSFCTLLKLLFYFISSRLCIIEDSKNLVLADSTVIGLTFSIIGQLDSSLLIRSNLPHIRKEGIKPLCINSSNNDLNFFVSGFLLSCLSIFPCTESNPIASLLDNLLIEPSISHLKLNIPLFSIFVTWSSE